MRTCLAALVLAGIAITPAVAADLHAQLLPYLMARDARTLGVVEGRVQWDRGRTGAPPAPLEGVSAILLPATPGFAAALDEVKSSFRTGGRAYVDSGRRLAEIRARYEGDLAAAGAGDLIRHAVSDASGIFGVQNLPAGRWLLLASQRITHALSPKRPSATEQRIFRGNVERSGYVAVTYWRLEVIIRPGGAVTVVLNDRNAWMTAIEEIRRPVDRP